MTRLSITVTLHFVDGNALPYTCNTEWDSEKMPFEDFMTLLMDTIHVTEAPDTLTSIEVKDIIVTEGGDSEKKEVNAFKKDNGIK